MADNQTFSESTSSRDSAELFCEGRHVSLQELKDREDLKGKHIREQYLNKKIPDYPTPVEFHITDVAHVTNKTNLSKIWASEGFGGPEGGLFSWWSLKITDADVHQAEKRYIETRFPDRSDEQRAAQRPFLSSFTTSPVFLERSRYGNFRFTFPLAELMDAYKEQICEGQQPVLRVWTTRLFKQEIQYAVLVHSPQSNERFKHLPPLASRNGLVAFDGLKVFWRAQAICETHNYTLTQRDNGTLEAKRVEHEYYVWDQLSFAFHTEKALTFTKRRLKKSLSSCELEETINLSKEEDCSKAEAEKIIRNLSPEDQPVKG